MCVERDLQTHEAHEIGTGSGRGSSARIRRASGIAGCFQRSMSCIVVLQHSVGSICRGAQQCRALRTVVVWAAKQVARAFITRLAWLAAALAASVQGGEGNDKEGEACSHEQHTYLFRRWCRMFGREGRRTVGPIYAVPWVLLEYPDTYGP